jgi:hypothetical protein
MRRMAAEAARSKRAQANLAGRTHAIGIKTGGGDVGLYVEHARLRITDTLPEAPEFTMVADDPAIFTHWVNDGSLTDAAIEGTLWLPHKDAFQVLPILNRLPRSIRRDLQDEKP